MVTNMPYAVTTTFDSSVPYMGTLWDQVELEPETYEYIEDAMEVAHIFNTATASSNFIVVQHKEA